MCGSETFGSHPIRLREEHKEIQRVKCEKNNDFLSRRGETTVVEWKLPSIVPTFGVVTSINTAVSFSHAFITTKISNFVVSQVSCFLRVVLKSSFVFL